MIGGGIPGCSALSEVCEGGKESGGLCRVEDSGAKASGIKVSFPGVRGSVDIGNGWGLRSQRWNGRHSHCLFFP